MTEWVVSRLGPDVPIHFTAFHPDYRMLDKTRTPPSTLTRARAIAIENGIRYAYTGNVHDPKGGSTYCHRCGERSSSGTGTSSASGTSTDGKCRFCGTPCAGVFEERPGSWGARRLPVRMSRFA